MAVGIKRLSRVQWAKEVTPGTALAATTRWRGMASYLDDQAKIEEIEEMMGIIEGADRTAIVQQLGMLNLAEAALTPEQLQYLLVMGMGGPVAGTTDGPGTDKIFVTNLPTTAKPTTTPYTIEAGDDFEVERMAYTVCTKISIKGATGAVARVSATLMGRQVLYYVTGFAAAAIPAVSELPVQQGKLYLDPIGGVYGATQVANLLIGYQIDITLKWQPVFTIDGSLAYAYPSFTGYEATGQLSFLHDTGSGGAAAGQLLLFRNQTAQLLRLDLIGDLVATPGTLYSNKRIIIDLPIKYKNPGPLSDNNGNMKYDFKFRSRYNTTAGNAGKFTVVTELTPLP
jgi:hypothetical protein